ncbi:hypothetical protein BH10PSE9_BH10PSE9_08110 [soil metagenome]
MTMAAETGVVPLEHNRRRETLIIGWVLLASAVFVALVFGMPVDGDATFRLAQPGDLFELPDLVVPARPYAFVVAALLAFFGARQFRRGALPLSAIFLGVGMALAVTAFLVWATAGKSFSLTGMLQATIVNAVPIAIGGLVGVLSERTTGIDIGIEGMLLSGEFKGEVAG